ncbi:MAG: DUF2334 domain-containing protein, partial [Halanaerobiales bacterium]
IAYETYHLTTFSRFPWNQKEEKKDYNLPALIIMYDDGNIQDYRKAFPLHQEHDIPGVVAVNPGVIGDKNRLDEGHLLLMEKDGWEIANHGNYHAGLVYNSITRDMKKNDTRLYVNNSYLVEPEYKYTLFNSYENISESISIKKIKTDDNGNTYLKLKEPLNRNYPVDNTYIKLGQKALEEEIVNSRDIFNNLGIDVNTFVYPYNGSIEEAREIVKENYQIARGGRNLEQSFPETFINYNPFDNHTLKGVSFENHLLPEDRLITLLEETKKEKGLLVMYAHTSHKDFKTERLENIIEIARKEDIDIITFNDLKNIASKN